MQEVGREGEKQGTGERYVVRSRFIQEYHPWQCMEDWEARIEDANYQSKSSSLKCINRSYGR